MDNFDEARKRMREQRMLVLGALAFDHMVPPGVVKVMNDLSHDLVETVKVVRKYHLPGYTGAHSQGEHWQAPKPKPNASVDQIEEYRLVTAQTSHVSTLQGVLAKLAEEFGVAESRWRPRFRKNGQLLEKGGGQ